MAFLYTHRWILLVLLSAFVIRIVIYTQIMNHTQNPDYYLYKEWIYKNYSYGFKNIYTIHSPHNIIDIDQPPGTIYILRGSYELFLVTARTLTHFLHLTPGATVWINDSLLIFFFRLPSILADLLIGTFIFIFLKKINKNIALLCSALYLLNPAVIYNSTVWGQMDSINNLFFYLSLVFLVGRRQFLSLLFLGLSLFTKFSLLPLVPFYFLFVLLGDNFNIKSFLKSLLVVAVIYILLCIPFSNNPLWIFSMITKVAHGIDQRITVNAYNFWWLILNPLRLATTQNFITSFLGIDINTWGFFAFSIIAAPIAYVTVKITKNKHITPEQVFFISFLVAFAAFVFLPKMHERYLYPIFPLLITWIGFKNKYWVSYIVLSILHFLNLYIVWQPDLFLFHYLEGAIRSQLTMWLISLTTVLIFFAFYIKMVRTFFLPIRIAIRK